MRNIISACIVAFVLISCLPQNFTHDNPYDPAFEGNKTKNILCPPPYGSANPYFMKGKPYVFVAPRTVGSDTIREWHFHSGGIGTFDSGWITSNRYGVTYTAGGTAVVSVEVRGSATTTFANNIVRIPTGGTAAFTEIGAGSISVWQCSSSAISLGDIDGDGDLDCIIMGATNIGGGSESSRIFRNNGAGGFSEIGAGSLFAMQNGNTALGDIDGDGDLDLILSGTDGGGAAKVKMYRNNGSGVFTETGAGTVAILNNGSIVLGDIDNDGDLDLIMTGTDGSARSKIYQNNGLGTFTEIGAGSLTPVYFSSISLGDLDRDGDLDLILTGYDGTVRRAKVYENVGAGAFTETGVGSLPGVQDSTTALADMDGDGDLDLLLSGLDTGGSRITKFFRNNGSGGFTDIGTGSLPQVTAASFSFGDIDADGDLDLIFTGSDGTRYSRIYRNNGSGTYSEFGPGTLIPINGSVSLGDIDSDGDLDLILAGWDGATRYGKIYRNGP
ncbi:MAG: VCBS repeat-containing protein [Spirochaetota bacterium]